MIADPRLAAGRGRPDVALFLPTLEGGGAERITLRLALGLKARGATVDLVTIRAVGQFRAAVPEGVSLVDLGAPRAALALPALMRYLRQARPAALLSALDHANITALLAVAGARTGTRIVIAVHNTILEHLAGLRGVRARYLMPWMMKRLYPRASAIVTVSEGAAVSLATFLGTPRERISVIPNPVVGGEIYTGAELPLHDPWFDPGGPPVILGLGRLVPQKGFDLLVRAFAALRREQEARLLIYGEGPERRSLEALARALGVADDVRLPGFTDRPYAALARSAVFALSSRYEGLPTVLIEALALGIPVVATDCPSGPREILAAGRFGSLVPVDDVEAFARALAHRLTTPRSALPEEALRPYTIESAARRYADLLGLPA